jgi:hypothetical protein
MSIIKTTNLNLTKNILLCLYTKFNTNEYKLTAASTCTGRCKSDYHMMTDTEVKRTKIQHG